MSAERSVIERINEIDGLRKAGDTSKLSNALQELKEVFKKQLVQIDPKASDRKERMERITGEIKKINTEISELTSSTQRKRAGAIAPPLERKSEPTVSSSSPVQTRARSHSDDFVKTLPSAKTRSVQEGLRDVKSAVKQGIGTAVDAVKNAPSKVSTVVGQKQQTKIKLDDLPSSPGRATRS